MTELSETKLYIAWLLLVIAIIVFVIAGMFAISPVLPDKLMIFLCSLGIATSICGTLLATHLEKQ
ncbi:MAG: hypothetical protein ACFFC7_16145 [Candidatus Hermodarchaeota archaeon]